MQRGIKSLSLIIAGVIGACGHLAASVIHVPADQPTIQAAINAAVNGDTVQVAPGTYVENINFLGKAITVAGDQAIIDGNHNGPVVTFASSEGPQSVLTGFTIQNGSAQFSGVYDGGGIRIFSASPTILLNTITSNESGGSGAGIYVYFGSPLIQDNLITNNREVAGWSGGAGMGIYVGGSSAARLVHNSISGNTAQQGFGGGIALFAAGTPLLQGNTVSGNSAYSQGGGIWIVNNSDALIVNNLFTGNSAPQGGAIYWGVPSGSRGPYLINNTFSGNTGTQGSTVFAGGFQAQALVINNIVVSSTPSATLYCDSSYSLTPPTLSSNDVFSTLGSSYTYGGTCATMNGTAGNISANPFFVGNGDYSLAIGSPAIDTGSSNQAPATDLNGAPRPIDGNGDGVAAFDMGAFEARGSSATTLSSSANPAGSGQSITFTASISPSSATGTVQFLDGAALLGTATVSNGSAAFVTVLTGGSHSITASYSGNPSFVGSSSVALSQFVRTATATSLVSSATQSTDGQPVTLTAQVSPGEATGSIQFRDGATSLGTVALSGGSAQLTVSLGAGSNALTAVYSGSYTFDPSTSPVVNVNVVKATAALSISSIPNPAVWGQSTTLRASLLPVFALGTVEFFDGGVSLGTGVVISGTATVTTNFLTVGNHSITAAYSGDSNFNPATSSLMLGVTQAPTSTSLTSSANPSVRNKPVSFTATVSPASATGSVKFFDGATLLATVNLSAGSGTFITSSLAPGTHSITAVYGGSTNLAGSTSPVLSQVVSKH